LAVNLFIFRKKPGNLAFYLQNLLLLYSKYEIKKYRA